MRKCIMTVSLERMNGTDHSENKLASEGVNEGLFEFMKLRFEERIVKPCSETPADISLSPLKAHPFEQWR